MHTTFVIIHVLSMIISMSLMSSAVGLGILGKSFSARVATYGLIATVVGTISGGTLFLGAPLSIQCALLTLYLGAVVLVYRFGFASGNATQARFIRQS
ncbi:MAG: hypothetical protein WAW80_00260 [Candidatus Saccharimonadales bacterium]